MREVVGRPVQPKTYLIDGYNVIRNTPGLAAAERRSLAEGRETLKALVAAKVRHTPHCAVIVFDGDGADRSTAPLARGVRGRVIFSRRGETADTVLRELAEEERAYGREVVGISDDLEVRLWIGERGGQQARVADLAQHLHAPDRYRERLVRHRQHVRGQLARDVDEPAPDRTRGNPKRAPRVRRDKPDSLF